MALDLTSVQAKLGRAEFHLETYRREITLWRDKKPYSISMERNEDYTRYYLVLRVAEKPNLLEWSLSISDCVHNFRSALENLIYAIAVHESRQNPPPKDDHLAFPIADNPKDFREVSRRIATLSEPVRTAIEAVQPYNRTHPAVPPPLAILREFEKTSKHKLLRLAFASQYKGEVSISLPDTRFGKGKFRANHGEVEDNTVLMSWDFEQPEPDVNFEKIDIGIAISLWHEKHDPSAPVWSNRSEASAILTLIDTEVRFVVDKVIAAVKV